RGDLQRIGDQHHRGAGPGHPPDPRARAAGALSAGCHATASRMSSPAMPPLVKIRPERDQMSATERRIADFILENAHLLRDYSSQQLASALCVSQSSVVKFSQKFGFRGYPDLKYSIGQALARNGGDVPAAPEQEAGDDYARLEEALRRSKAAAEEETRLLNPRERMEEIVRLVDGAARVFVFGLGDDGLFAREFAMRLS